MAIVTISGSGLAISAGSAALVVSLAALPGTITLSQTLAGNLAIEHGGVKVGVDIGDTVALTAVFKDRNASVADPATVTLVVRSPDGTRTSYVYGGSAIVKSSTGNYYYDLALTLSGKWGYRWTSTGTPALSEEESFMVNSRKV